MKDDSGSRRAWFEQEARKVLNEDELAPDPSLIADGWERRFIADAQRAKEAMELYTQLGFDVRAEPIRPADLRDDCDDCRVVAALQFTMIYTRRTSRPSQKTIPNRFE